MRKIIVLFLIVILVLAGIFFIVKNPVSGKMNVKGIEYFKEGNFEKAEKAFLRSYNLNKKNIEPLINLIKCYIEQEKYAVAETWLAKLMIIAPEHAETYGLQGLTGTVKQDYLKALEHLNLAIAADSTLAYLYFYRGIVNANLGNLEEAANDYLKARSFDENNLKALEERAVILNKLNDFEGSIGNYNMMLELDPSNKDAFFNRGTFKMKIGDFEGAIADFDNTIKLDDQFAEAYFNKGKSHANLGQFDLATECFRKSASFGFKETGALYNAGLASFKDNNLNEAKSYLLKSINKKEESEYLNNAYNILGVIEMMNGNQTASLSYFDKSISIDSTDADVFYNRGIAYGMLKEYAKALRDLNKCVALGRETPDVYFALGVNKISLSNFSAGCKDLKKAALEGYEQARTMNAQYCKDYQ